MKTRVIDTTYVIAIKLKTRINRSSVTKSRFSSLLRTHKYRCGKWCDVKNYCTDKTDVIR